ncbi:MAG: hypothetical protein PXY39_07315 [archaeon]|nr:hypothetical protein [archaeon]
MQTKTLYGIITVLIAVVIIVSGFATLYYYEYSQAQSANQIYVSQLKQLNVKYVSNIVIDYGNGTKNWYNNTKVEPGWNLYTVTLVITNGNVNATCCEFNSHFVTGINGVENTLSTYWWIWTYNSTASWQTAQVGVDQLKVYNSSIYAWTFCGSNAAGNPNCSPP